MEFYCLLVGKVYSERESKVDDVDFWDEGEGGIENGDLWTRVTLELDEGWSMVEKLQIPLRRKRK